MHIVDSSMILPLSFPFPYQVQFGHAGSCANAADETADAKNKALKEAGAIVPHSFDELGDAIRYFHLVLFLK